MTYGRAALAGILLGFCLLMGCTGKAPAAAKAVDPEWCGEHARPEAECLPCKMESMSAGQCSDQAPVCGEAK